jgi:regulator of sigma E protease
MITKLLHILEIPLVLIEVLVVFNLMIIVHELGHFLAARWRKMTVEKFGIWFGKPIWKKTINGVEYSFGTLPFGGFVALPQMAPMEMLEGKSDTPRDQLPPVTPLSKIIVAFAGPLFSFLLAVVFATIVWLVGRPVSESESTTTVGWVVPDSPAAHAGFQVGDQILSVDGKPVNHFGGMGSDSISWRIVRSEGDTVPVVVQRTIDGAPKTITLNPEPEIEPTSWWQRKGLREIGVAPAQHPMVAQVDPGSPADKAGLKPNDVITAVDGQPAYTLEWMADVMRDHPAPSYTLDVDRDGAQLKLPFTPLGAIIDVVSKDGPADQAGLKAGDLVTAVDGVAMPDGSTITEYITSHSDKAMKFTVKNATGETHDLTITPVLPTGETIPRIGLAWADEFGIAEDEIGKFHVLHPSPVEQIGSGVMSIFNTIGAIASSKSHVGLQHMGGPVFMVRAYYSMFQSREGWRLALWFSVVINVNLALINMLPLPVLDGGHITLAILESIRRRPANVRFLEAVNMGCFLLVFGFMLYIMFFDVQDFFAAKQMHFEPKANGSQVQH